MGGLVGERDKERAGERRVLIKSEELRRRKMVLGGNQKRPFVSLSYFSRPPLRVLRQRSTRCRISRSISDSNDYDHDLELKFYFTLLSFSLPLLSMFSGCF